jgi:hypothetical protein
MKDTNDTLTTDWVSTKRPRGRPALYTPEQRKLIRAHRARKRRKQLKDAGYVEVRFYVRDQD